MTGETERECPELNFRMNSLPQEYGGNVVTEKADYISSSVQTVEP